jgi:hypothetical protein
MSVIVVKVLVGLTPSYILQQVFASHAKPVYGVGLVIGSVVAWCIPPRGTAKQLVALISCAVILGIIRMLLP